ncbi:hypothetical protein MSAN_02416700 [Mycena sanguinolenta]|uniref:DUF6534 domain-containing protein n=1 Tax=Mycena sanguinolenta TaxID=230812 RepID=A0A8H6X3N0_9AGAR|nr:hypothetical protein MSAN_02416700 [Mycena sanguinolenta]
MAGFGVGLLFGPMLIGVILNMMLYGSIVTQMFRYFQRFSNDPGWIRFLMLYLFIVETANVVVQCGIIYEPLIIKYGTSAAVSISPKLLPGDSLIISMVSAPIQIFSAWRISVITRSYILPSIIAMLSLASFGSGIEMCTKVFMIREFHQFGAFNATATVWLACTAACDVVIALGMTHALYTRKTGFGTVDGQINRIIRLTLQTGSLTAAAALVDIILFLAMPMTSTNFIVDFPLSALYIISILAMLNSRETRRSWDSEQAHSAPQMLSNLHEMSTFQARQPRVHSKQFDVASTFAPGWTNGPPLPTAPDPAHKRSISVTSLHPGS